MTQAPGLSEAWCQEVAEALRLAPLSPATCNALVSAVELQLRRLIQQAHKFQRRAKSSVLKVEDMNLALTTNRLEPVYGLHLSESLTMGAKFEDQRPIKSNNLISLSEFALRSVPSCPIKPQLALHWLAVLGAQPNIPENPHVVTAEAAESLPSLVEKELQLLYARMTGILSVAQDSKGLAAVYKVLQADPGIQDLVPYFSRFFYAQIKENTKKLVVTRVMIKGIRALQSNPVISLDVHLTQLLPAIFTCVVSAKLCQFPDEDHWALREQAAALVAELVEKYHSKFPDLLSRVCKTYTDALEAERSLPTVFGGIVGLRALGMHIVKTVLLDLLPALSFHLLSEEAVQVNTVAACSRIVEEPVELVEDEGLALRKVLHRDGALQQSLSAALSTLPKDIAMDVEDDDECPPPPDDDCAAQPVASKVLLQPVLVTASNSGATGVTMARKKQAWKDLEERFSRDMCREALRVALGRYMFQAMRAPDLPWTASQPRALKPSRSKFSSVVDLEETLVPFFSINSSQITSCGLVL